MNRGRERKVRKLWLSTDDGKTWHETEALEGSILYHASIHPGDTYKDGFGNLYRSDDPNA